MLIEGGLSIQEAGRRLSLSASTLGNGVKAFKAGKLGDVGKTHRELSDKDMELHQLRRGLAQVNMERDILKKAAAYFAKESQRNMR